MARPTTIRKEQILDAARELFLEHGLSVSTATIAKAAGVSEGTIFKRFSTKEELFLAAMCPAELDLGLEVEAGAEDLRAALVQAGIRLVGFYRELMPRVMRLWAHAGSDTPFEVMRRQGTPPPVHLVQAVTRFVEAEMNKGRLARGDAGIVARTFVASMHNVAFFEMLSGEPPAEGAAEAYVRKVVDMLWRGIAPPERGDPSR